MAESQEDRNPEFVVDPGEVLRDVVEGGDVDGHWVAAEGYFGHEGDHEDWRGRVGWAGGVGDADGLYRASRVRERRVKSQFELSVLITRQRSRIA